MPPAKPQEPAGTPTVGEALTASDGTWSNTPTSFAYQWLRCNSGGNSCVSVANRTLKTYTFVGADADHTMRVRVTATNADGSNAAQSAQTASVAAATSSAAPKNTAPPTITGTPKVGQTLTADPGSWSGNPTSFAYQWQRCDADVAACQDLIGATSRTDAVPIAEVALAVPSRPWWYRSRKIVNPRPTLAILGVQFTGSTVYAHFRICDASTKNLSIIETDSRPGKLSNTRRFATLAPPLPCGVYTRHWLPVAPFRDPGHYTLTLRAQNKSGLISLPARRTFSHG
jgi:hypothetical protein